MTMSLLNTFQENFLDKIGIVHIVLVSFSIHMFVLSHPSYEILDEKYFTYFTRWFMLGMDHTPYQLFGLSLIEYPFVSIIGDNWFSWRFPIVIFGMVFLYFNYKVIEHLKNKKIALLATGILCFSPMIFTHSTLLLRDIPVMAMGFMALYFYFKQKYYFSALLIGLSALIKETAIFFLIFVIIHYGMTNYKNLGPQLASKKFKTPFISCIILLGAFLIPITIYDNTITVLEYTTSFPEYLYYDENSELKVKRFDIRQTNSTILSFSVDDFNYMNKVTNPIHHISLFFTKGYYDGYNGSNEFVASFLPVEDRGTVFTSFEGKTQTFTPGNDLYEKHYTDFPTSWNQSAVNYSWWHIAFYSCIGLIAYAIYSKIKNKTELSQESKILICGIVSFFIPFLIIDGIRNTYAYYMIYYLPIMAFGLVFAVYKIPKPKVKSIVIIGFCIAILANFAWMFPING